MKWLPSSSLRNFRPAAAWALAAGLGVLVAPPPLAAQTTWDGGGGNNYWNTKNNWNPNTTPGSGTTVLFDNSSVGTLPATIELRGDRNVNILNFDTGDTLAIVNGTGNRTLDLYSGQINRTVGSSGNQSLDFKYLDLRNNGAFAINGGGAFTISSIIRNNGGSPARAITKSGNGTLILSGANTYTGATTVSGGILSVISIGDGGVAGGLGQASNAAGNLVLNGGTLRYTGGTTTTNRRFTLGTAGGTLDASGSGTLKFTDTGAIALTGTNTARTLTLTGTNTSYYNDGSTLAGILANNGTGITSLTKEGTGTWRLTGANTYTGDTTINNGTLQLGANHVLSDSTNIIIAGPGTLQLNSTTETVGSLSGSGTLYLQGGAFTTSTAANTTFSGTISDSYGSFRKAGPGDLTLSGNSTYTGLTYIDGGTLIAASSTALGGSSYGNVIASGATLGLQGGVSLTEGSFTLEGTGDGGGGAINNISGHNSLDATLNFSGATTIGSSAGTLNLSNLTLNANATMIGAGDIAVSGAVGGSSDLI